MNCPAPAPDTARVLAGSRIRLRAPTPHDIAGYAALISGLTYGTCFFRFGTGEIDDSKAVARRHCTSELPAWRRLVAAAERADGDELIASACYTMQPSGLDCELTILVTDAWQGTTLAHWLLTELIADARSNGVRSLTARVLGTNRRMLRFAARHGFRADPARAAPIRTLRLTLDPAGDD